MAEELRESDHFSVIPRLERRQLEQRANTFRTSTIKLLEQVLRFAAVVGCTAQAEGAVDYDCKAAYQKHEMWEPYRQNAGTKLERIENSGIGSILFISLLVLVTFMILLLTLRRVIRKLESIEQGTTIQKSPKMKENVERIAKTHSPSILERKFIASSKVVGNNLIRDSSVPIILHGNGCRTLDKSSWTMNFRVCSVCRGEGDTSHHTF